MGIITGILTYFFGFIINLVDSAVTLFLEALGFSITGFEEYFPAAADFYDIIIGFSIGLLLLQFIFQLFKNFGVMLDMEAEEPLQMTGKVFLFFGMIMATRSINDFIIKLLMGPYNIFLNYDSSLSFSFWDLVENIFNHVVSSPFMTLIYLIMIIIIGFQFIKFLLEVVERYIVFMFVLYTAPLAYSTGPYKSTAQIFKSWCRMLASQALLLILNIWCIKVFLSGLGIFIQQGEADFFYYLLLYAFLKFSQKVDTLLRIIGMNTASTGSTMKSVGGAVAGIAMSLQRTGQAVGNLMKGGTGAKLSTADAGSSGKGTASTSGSGSAGGISMQKGSANSGETTGSNAGGNSPATAGATNNTQGLGDATEGIGEGLTNTNEASAGQSNGNSPTAPLGKAVDATMNSAKQNYAKDVLSAAKSQQALNGSTGKLNESTAGNQPTGNQQTGTNKGVDLAGKENNMSQASKMDTEVKEGISNLARGLPHTSYDQITGKHEGGGFEAFSGEDANIIGASEMVPSDGYSQQSVKMPDGSNSTVYSGGNGSTAQSVKFDKVDNGVITGSISPISNITGKMNQSHPFTAVHDSVPGAGSGGSSSARVSDGDGGSYYVSSHGDTSMFKPYSSNIDGNVQATSNSASAGSGAVSQMSKEQNDTATSGGSFESSVGGSLNGNSVNSATNNTGATYSSESGPSVPLSSNDHSSKQQVEPSSMKNTTDTSSMSSTGKNGNGANTSPSNLRRFSKNNPENFEVFKKTDLQ